jgi:D-alanine-D-alanine ligase
MKKNVAVIMGGYSSEYKISILSGNVVVQNLDKNLFNVFPIHILEDKWVYVAENQEEFPINKADFSIPAKDVKIDIVFNAIHGTPGEDGFMQAYFELLNIPHTSCPMYQAALTFNKKDCLSVLKSYDVKMAASFYLHQNEKPDLDTIIRKVGLPCFVKPNKAGSSFGISKVMDKAELQPALDKAFQEDDELLIEAFLDGVEVTVGVVEYQGEVKVLPITEIVPDDNHRFFDYVAKYEGASKEITPARISDELTTYISQEAKRIYKILNMKGMSRSEFIIVNNIPYFLEMNIIPGLTEMSLLPQQVKASGISLQDFFTDMVNSQIQ